MKHKSQKGFTLIELAVALTIVSLVIGGLAVPMSTRIAEQQYTDTQATLDKAVEALIGFAVLNGRLPCPDIDTAAVANDDRDGVEDAGAIAATTCAAGAAGLYATSSDEAGASWGDLPWQTLGIAPPNHADAWNNRIRYAVATPLALNTNRAIRDNLAGATLLDIRCGNPTNPVGYAAAPGCLPNVTPYPIAANFASGVNAVFVVYSVGANGWGGTSINGVATTRLFSNSGLATTSDQGANAPELETAVSGATTALDRRRQFVIRARTDATSASGEFDDLLTFMSSNTLAAKLLNAGTYP